MAEPVLNASDINSPTWKRIKEHYEARLLRLRIKNDVSRSEVETARLRGQIAEIKTLLDLDKPSPVIQVDAGE